MPNWYFKAVLVRMSAVMLTLWPIAASGQEPCPPEANDTIEAGWTSYRAQAYRAADSLFRLVLIQCPGHADARTGLAYAQLQTGELDTALAGFQSLLDQFPEHIDALIGAGLTLWRREEFDPAIRLFRRLDKVDPGNETAATYLPRLIDVGFLIGRPPEQPADTLEYRSRAHARHFDVLKHGEWTPFYVNGINLGAALPGRNPSEFPDSLTYVRWLNQMGDVGFNTIRVYTNHPPYFYQALREYNLGRPNAPLWLLHGSWTSLPENGRYDQSAWRDRFFTEMYRTVDIIHGRADMGLADDLTEPYYDADVSRWTLAYIVGREWEPSSLEEYHKRFPDQTSWDGKYFQVRDGLAAEVLLAELCEVMTQYETENYGHQRPIAFTSWPTLDPLYHVSEATRDEQHDFRRAFGYPVGVPERKAENDDAINVDPGALVPTDAMPAGTFGVFHAYPYYPDFMINDPAQQGGRSPDGISNYFTYLVRLRESIRDIPLIVGEYGVPTSLINAHLQPQGWHHGGHTERAMADIDARLTREIAAAGFAGGAIFAWIDEWFKKNWLVIDFELPAERNRLWWNRLDPEQHYGMYAMEPEPRLGDGRLADRLDTWREVEPLYIDRWGTIRVTSDEAYIHLLFESADGRLPEQLYYGFDIIGRNQGDHRWPDPAAGDIPVGVEFVVSVAPDEVRVLVDSASNPIEVINIGWTLGDSTRLVYQTMDEGRPAGFFTGRFTQGFPDSVVTRYNADGAYEGLRVVTNDTRIGRDTVEYAGSGYDRGYLAAGAPPDGLWEVERGIIEIRIPWMLINFTDPSQRRVLQGAVRATTDVFGTELVEDIGIVATAFDGNRWRSWPLPDRPENVARFGWDTWDVDDIRWRTRKRPVADALNRTYRRLRPIVLQEHRRP